MRVYEATVTTTGSAGAATGSATIKTQFPGWVEWVYLAFSGSAPASTDTTITHAATADAIGGTILAVTNSATSGLFYPRAAAVDTANTAITNSGEKIAVAGPLAIALAQCDALAAAVKVYVCITHVN